MIGGTRGISLGLSGVIMVALAACSPAVPDSGAGVGFDNYSQYQRQREAQLAGNAATLPPAASVSSETLPSTTASTTAAPASEAESLAADTRAVLNSANTTANYTPSTGAGTTAQSGVLEASPSNPAPVAVNSVGISNENDFEAVGDQRSIAADAALIEQNKANYTVVQPEALPARTDTGPNIVAFALQTNHGVGQQVYRRTNLPGAENRYQRVCSNYPSPDLAQTEFLQSGGPERDRRGMDPDGDGFACSWDPRPFRKAAGG
ncbi:hypothetical protein [Pseudooceanicola sp. MF1-13]|uniref:hypothetical protein n=1 Tax=Pseudooceanicola sp. MF1-13 TaxID=3379095 RepID=UPI0038917327